MDMHIIRIALACVVLCCWCSAFAATYNPGFSWDWTLDFSASDFTPGDAGSIAAPANAGLSSGPASDDVWAYMGISPPGGWPEGTTEPVVMLSQYLDYYGGYGHMWCNGGNWTPGIGVDDGSTNFAPGWVGRHFLQPYYDAAPGPDDNHESSVLRWTAPVTGYYDVDATFTLQTLCPSDGVGVRVVKNTTSLNAPIDIVLQYQTKEFSFPAQVLNAGDQLYFAVANNGTGDCDETILMLKIKYQGAVPTRATSWHLY